MSNVTASLFTEEEKKLLEPYVTSADDDVYAVMGLTGMTGAVYARYSRAKGGFRETLLKEFIKEGVIDAQRAGDLIERVLIAFGDDSVGELEGAHVSFEEISILATKEIEDRRIGGSPIEQSTRYVFYDMKRKGRYRYYLDPAIMASQHAEAYVEAMDFIFDTYAALIDPMKAFYKNRKPLDEAEYDVMGSKNKLQLGDLTPENVEVEYRKMLEKDEKGVLEPAETIDFTEMTEKLKKAFRQTYKSDIRTKACDTLRNLLPVATLTNVGVFGNGRFFQNVLTHCYSSPYQEVREIAAKAHEALNQHIPRYVQRAEPNAYVMETHTKMQALANALFSGITPAKTGAVTLLDRGEVQLAAALAKGEVNAATVSAALTHEKDSLVIAQMLFPYLNHPLRQVRDVVRAMPEEKREAVIKTYLGNREHRRNRPGRALEAGYPYTFDLKTDFGTYKDLMRHRMMTQNRQRFTPTLGFNMPEDLVEAGYEDMAQSVVDTAIELYERLLPDFPELASYATLHGSDVQWSLGINDRALMHMIELRTTPQGHPSYRKVCQIMHKAVAERHAWRADAMQFADHGDYYWARGDSEARQRVKEAALEKKE